MYNFFLLRRQYFKLHCGGQLYWWRKPGNPEKTTDKLYHVMLYTSPWSRFELTTSVVIGTDCIISCKSNYHTITSTPVPSNVYGFTISFITKLSSLSLSDIRHYFCFTDKILEFIRNGSTRDMMYSAICAISFFFNCKIELEIIN